MKISVCTYGVCVFGRENVGNASYHVNEVKIDNITHKLYSWSLLTEFIVFWSNKMKSRVNKSPLSAHLVHSRRHELLKTQEDGMKFLDTYILNSIEVANEEIKTRPHIER